VSARPGWATSAERGSILLLRFVVWFQETLGRRAARLILYPTVLYFFLTGAKARRASRQYLEHLYAHHGPLPGLATPPRWWHPLIHIFSFAQNTLDRFCLWARKFDSFEFERQGAEHIMKCVEEKRGAILLGAHLGSFDVLRVLSEVNDIVVNVVMFTDNAERINAIFKELDPGSEMRVIQLDPNSVRSAFEVKRCIDRGEFVAVLGDRVGLYGRDRVAWAPFLGKPAPFPTGPFLLSVILRAPVILTVALRVAPGHYRMIAEPFCGDEAVPRNERDKAVEERIERFAGRLEHHCASAPFQWFNFYDFWTEEEGRGA
jgi:predicted LPLAT superfamily acyltransferase